MNPEQIDDYLFGYLEGEELKKFEMQMSQDSMLKQRVKVRRALLSGIEKFAEKNTNLKIEPKAEKDAQIRQLKPRFSLAKIAASIAFLAFVSLGSYFVNDYLSKNDKMVIDSESPLQEDEMRLALGDESGHVKLLNAQKILRIECGASGQNKEKDSTFIVPYKHESQDIAYKFDDVGFYLFYPEQRDFRMDVFSLISRIDNGVDTTYLRWGNLFFPIVKTESKLLLKEEKNEITIEALKLCL